MPGHTLPGKRALLIAMILTGSLLLVSAAAIRYIRLGSPLSPDNFVHNDGLMDKDLERLAAERYDSVFLSMHPASGFTEEDFRLYRGLHTLVTSHALLSTGELSAYLDGILTSGNATEHIYLCLDPELLWAAARRQASKWESLLQENLYRYIGENPGITFEILLPYPYIEYWLNLKEEDFNALLSVYSSLSAGLLAYPNTKLFFPGTEYWVIINPDNYENSYFVTNPAVTQKLFLYTFCDGIYRITPENMDGCWNTLRETVARETASPTQYPDLSDWCVVFFGDSVFANYPGSYGIPGYMEGLSGVSTRNYAVGGACSSAFPSAVNRFLDERDTFPDAGKKLCFIIQYGFNDYFTGAPVENPRDPFDVSSYKGALRTGIAALQAAYPQAGCLLVTPTHTSLFENGTAIMGATGGSLSAYADAAVETASQLNIHCLDNYHSFAINEDNLLEYTDGIHPNESGRLLIASEFMDYISSHME